MTNALFETKTKERYKV